MAIVRDPITGQVYDDGRPAPAGGPAPPQQAAAVNAYDIAQRASLAALTQPRGTEIPLNRATPVVDPLAQARAVRLNDMAVQSARQPALGAPPVAVNRASTAMDPLAQAGAVNAYDIAQRAVQRANAPVNAPLRPQQGVAGPQPQGSSVLEPGTAFANAVGGALGVNFQPGLPYGQPGAASTTGTRAMPPLSQRIESYVAGNPVLNAIGSAPRAVGDVLEPVARVGLGALAYPVAAGVEGLRASAVEALGGDVGSLPGGGTSTSDAARAMIQRGAAQLGDLASGAGTALQDAALGLLGARRAQPAAPVAPVVAAPTVAAQVLSPTPTAQVAQSSALGGTAPRDYDAEVASAVQPAPALSADQQPQRGNYSQYNTNLDALRQRALPTAGIDLGAAALAAERNAAPTAPRGLTVVGTGNNLRNLLTSESADERLAARALLRDARERDIAAGRVNAELERARMAGQFGLQDTGLRGQFGLQERELANVAQVEAARQQGLASLAAAEARAAGTVQAAQLRSQGQAGTEALRQQEALAAQIRNAQLLDALARNDMQTYQQLQFGRFAPQPQTFVDPLTGAPLSPEQIAALQAASLSRLNP